MKNKYLVDEDPQVLGCALFLTILILSNYI